MTEDEYNVLHPKLVELNRMAKESTMEQIREHSKELLEYRATLRDLKRVGIDTNKAERLIKKQYKDIKRWKRWLNR